MDKISTALISSLGDYATMRNIIFAQYCAFLRNFRGMKKNQYNWYKSKRQSRGGG